MVEDNSDAESTGNPEVARPLKAIESPGFGNLVEFAGWSASLLASADPILYGLLSREWERQNHTLMMIAAASVAHPSVLACEGTALMNLTTEGYPGRRFHAGCEVIDEIERLAIQRAKAVFGACYANVQPHSGTSANLCVIMAVLSPGDTLMGLDLEAGGHLSHGSIASVVGRYFNAIGYGLDHDGRIDYDQVYELARLHRPKLIICGASSYSRIIDFKRFREIADATDAFLLADISHIAGLVAAGEHPSPINHAHFTTTSTYKQLYGPRGGLILMGRDAEAPSPLGRGTLGQLMQRAVFPSAQATPNMAAIAAKARALDRVGTDAFRKLARQIVLNAKALAEALTDRGYKVLTGGTDNHMVIVDVGERGMTGVVAERALEECGILVNRNRIPGDHRPASIASGLRFGTNSLASRGMAGLEMHYCSELVDATLKATTLLADDTYNLDPIRRRNVSMTVRDLCRSFPLPGYSRRSIGLERSEVCSTQGGKIL